jgi:hypothetical protein
MKLFGFKSKKDEVLNHWIAFAENFNFPPAEFYTLIERTLAEKKIPSMDTSCVEYPEGGLLSEGRVYMRMLRERLAFDMCAAPFGADYFFSCRTVYSPAVLKLWHLLVLLFVLGLINSLLTWLLGPKYALIALVGLLIAIAQIFRNTLAMGLSDLDAALLKTPALGPVYERWFRKDTYYRQDARLVFLHTIPKIVQEVAEETTAAKGVKLLQQYQVAPVLGELYKPIPASKTENS